MEKTLFELEKQSWTKAKENCFKFLEFAEENFWLSGRTEKSNFDSIWDKIQKICDLIVETNNGEDLSYQEKHAIASLEDDEMKEFLDNLVYLGKNVELSSNDKKNFDNFILTCERTIESKVGGENFDQNLFNILNRTKILEVQLDDEFETVLYLLGIKEFILPYSFSEFSQKLSNQDEKMSMGRFLITLVDAKTNEKEGNLFAKYVISNILFDEDLAEIENRELWFNWLVVYYSLDLAWSRLSKLDEIQRLFLFQNYYYKSLVMGLPIEKFISEYLSDSLDPIEFVYKHKKMKNWLDTNEEKVLVDLENNSFEMWINVLKKYIGLNTKDYLDGYKVNEFLNNLYGSTPGRESFISWLRKSFAVYFSINEATLVDWDDIAEDKKGYEYDKEMVKAILYFQVGGVNLEKIVEMLSKEDKKFGLYAFVREIKKLVDLDKEEDVNKILDFSSLLKENNLLPEDQEIIIFNEQTDSFEFNNDLKV